MQLEAGEGTDGEKKKMLTLHSSARTPPSRKRQNSVVAHKRIRHPIEANWQIKGF